MDNTKKDRPKAATFRRQCPGLASANQRKLIIPDFQRIASPNPDGGGGVLPRGPRPAPGRDRRGFADAYN